MIPIKMRKILITQHKDYKVVYDYFPNLNFGQIELIIYLAKGDYSNNNLDKIMNSLDPKPKEGYNIGCIIHPGYPNGNNVIDTYTPILYKNDYLDFVYTLGDEWKDINILEENFVVDNFKCNVLYPSKSPVENKFIDAKITCLYENKHGYEPFTHPIYGPIFVNVSPLEWFSYFYPRTNVVGEGFEKRFIEINILPLVDITKGINKLSIQDDKILWYKLLESCNNIDYSEIIHIDI